VSAIEEHMSIADVRIDTAACLLMWGGALGGSAYAQEQEQQTQLSSLEQITITGTRIRRDDFTSPTPTTVIDSEFLQNLGIVNAGDAMKQMPQNLSTNSPTTTPGTNFFNGSNLTNLRGLDPFFGSRSLTLVDSRRHLPTNQGDGVDLNFIPTVIIERMEVVTGGASASYGSGAISGVTNILLDRDLDGIRGEIDFGTTEQGEGDDLHLGFAYGAGIGDKGHLVVGVEGQDAHNIQGCAAARDWCARNYTTIANPSFPDGANPQFFRLDGIRQSWNSHNGIFYIPRFNGRAPNTQAVVPLDVTDDGAGLQNYDTGLWSDGPVINALGGNPNRALSIGGSGEGVFDDAGLRTSVERTAGYFAFTYDITSRLGFFVDASGGSVDAFSPQYFVEANGLCMAPDYGYLPHNPAAQALFANPGNLNCNAPGTPGNAFDGIVTKKNWENQLDTANVSTADLTRYAAGFDGQFGDSSWTWDAYFQYGESERVQNVYDVRAGARYNLAFDAVLVNGEPVCRGTTPLLGYPTAAQDILRSACTPINIFGQAPLTAAQKSYAFGYLRENTTVEQQIIEATVSGSIAAGFGAGPIQLAAGLSDRSESIANIAAEELGDVLRRDIGIQYGDSFSGEVDVVELFAELDMPILERFALNLAARKSEYDNTAGAATGVEGQTFAYDIDTWKVAGDWQLLEPLRIRFSRSRDARAPNFRELYYRLVTPHGVFFCSGLGQPWLTPGNSDSCSFDVRGGLELRPEEADTTTFGFVIAPPGANLKLAVDLYEIELSEAITPADTGLVVANCANGDQQSCDQITGITQPYFNPTNPTIPCTATCFSDIDTIVATAFNLRSYEFTGADFSADWVKALATGSLGLRFVATRTFHQKIRGTNNQNPTSVEDITGATGVPTGILSDWASAADLIANLTASFRRNDFTITGQARYVADGVNDRLQRAPGEPGYDIAVAPGPGQPQSVNVNNVPSYTIYSLSGTYDFDLRSGNRMQFWGSVNNLFDKEPPLVGGGVGGAQPLFFDTLGRTYRVGLRMSF
jgi:outer membrane receptor protein involved in Fe transport